MLSSVDSILYILSSVDSILLYSEDTILLSLNDSMLYMNQGQTKIQDLPKTRLCLQLMPGGRTWHHQNSEFQCNSM